MLFWTSFRTVTWFTVFSTQTASTLNHHYMRCQGECRDGKKSRTYKYLRDLKIRDLSMCSGKSPLEILFGSFQLLESTIGRFDDNWWRKFALSFSQYCLSKQPGHHSSKTYHKNVSVFFYNQLFYSISEVTWVLVKHIECNSSLNDRISYNSCLRGYCEFILGNYLQMRD